MQEFDIFLVVYLRNKISSSLTKMYSYPIGFYKVAFGDDFKSNFPHECHGVPQGSFIHSVIFYYSYQ